MNLIFSENSDYAYGRVSDFKNIERFVEAIQKEGYLLISSNDIKIEPCINTLEGIESEIVIPLSQTDVVIENYFVADVCEIE